MDALDLPPAPLGAAHEVTEGRTETKAKARARSPTQQGPACLTWLPALGPLVGGLAGGFQTRLEETAASERPRWHIGFRVQLPSEEFVLLGHEAR